MELLNVNKTAEDPVYNQEKSNPRRSLWERKLGVLGVLLTLSIRILCAGFC